MLLKVIRVIKKSIKNYNGMDKPLLIVSTILFIFGLLMILSASNIESFVRYGAGAYNFFWKQLSFLAAGGLATVFLISIPLKTYDKYNKIIFWGFLMLLGVLLVNGKATNNSVSWLNLGFTRLQPSEFLKVFYILAFASYYEMNRRRINDPSIFTQPLKFFIACFVLIVVQPDLGTALIFMVIMVSMFMSLPIKKEPLNKFMVQAFGGAISIIAVSVVISGSFLTDEQFNRLDYTNPCGDYENEGFQVCNSYIAVNNGGLFGVGLGNSSQKYLYLPEAHTDFIYAIIVEETGLVGGLIVILLLIFIIVRILIISTRSFMLKNQLIAYGVAIYISIHVLVNLCGILGILPMTGVPLPFLSYGGSFTLSLVLALGLVQRVNIESNLEKGIH